jgi:ketosteroid isomerase-like protein
MSSDAERIALIERGWSLFEAGDAEAMLPLFHPDLEINSPVEMGNPGRYHGREGWEQWVSHWFEAWDEFKQEMIRAEAVGERSVIAEVHQAARGRATGIEIERTIAYVYEVRDGKLAYLSLRPDLEAAREHALERESAASSD